MYETHQTLTKLGINKLADTRQSRTFESDYSKKCINKQMSTDKKIKALKLVSKKKRKKEMKQKQIKLCKSKSRMQIQLPFLSVAYFWHQGAKQPTKSRKGVAFPAGVHGVLWASWWGKHSPTATNIPTTVSHVACNMYFQK